MQINSHLMIVKTFIARIGFGEEMKNFDRREKWLMSRRSFAMRLHLGSGGTTCATIEAFVRSSPVSDRDTGCMNRK
jgi:hypothetical protein